MNNSQGLNKNEKFKKGIKIGGITTLILILLEVFQALPFFGYPSLHSIAQSLMKKEPPAKASPSKIPITITPVITSFERKYKLLEKLSVNVQLSHIEKYIGESVIKKVVKTDKSLKEHIYIEDLYYIQIITNQEDNVIAFAVTTRSENFKPQFKIDLIAQQIPNPKSSVIYELNQQAPTIELYGDMALESYPPITINCPQRPTGMSPWVNARTETNHFR